MSCLTSTLSNHLDHTGHFVLALPLGLKVSWAGAATRELLCHLAHPGKKGQQLATEGGDRAQQLLGLPPAWIEEERIFFFAVCA